MDSVTHVLFLRAEVELCNESSIVKYLSASVVACTQRFYQDIRQLVYVFEGEHN